MTDDIWAPIPPHLRSAFRSYVNSEQPADVAHAHALCARYGVDYAALRLVILGEMVDEARAIEARRAGRATGGHER